MAAVAGEVIVFEDDDAAYLDWTRKHTRGFVVNTTRPPTAGYLMLHWADCRDISGRWEVWTSGEYLKVCGTSLDGLEQWATEATNGTLRKCAHCWAI